MDFSLTEAQQQLVGLVRQITDAQLTQQRHKEIEGGAEHVDRALWSALADAGVLSAGIPEAAGGSGLDVSEQCSVLIELGRAVAPVPYVAGIFTAAAALAEFGTEAQRSTWLTGALDGSTIVTTALTEDLSDTPERPFTRADASSAGWVLTGTKAVVPHGTIADAILVPATTPDGPRVFIVTPGDAGVRLTAQVVVDGDTEATLELEGVQLGADRLLGAAEVLPFLLARQTIGVAAFQLGVVERALELTAEYARSREQFGRPIGSFQAVAQRLADAYIDVEGLRLTVWEAVWRVSEGLPASTELATAKFWAADAGHRVAHTAVHVHGGTGIDTDGPLHRYFVAAKRNEFALGSATAQLRRLGAELAITPA
ncbi:acyl-CoA dehydrogenase family protein [Jatrophihabitans sp.]|uniref:acyl-CoA dehydrogenase family protein n=1 Tax=Jatrophihabitans sp. TaxID=1932789 RepID=UPI0030C6ED24|nr:acyl-CoA dehydrogenase [Jatrophihabitans sp.]